jgi:hypothetical protein
MTVDIKDRPDVTQVIFILTPLAIDAGVRVTLNAAVVCNPATDLTGRVLCLIDATGAKRAEMVLSGFDGVANHGSVEIIAPPAPGRYLWSARLTQDIAGGDDAGNSFDLAFDVQSHRIDVTAWNAPSAIARGSRFVMNVGLRCSAGCDLSGRPVEIEDENGRPLATVRTGAMPRAGTDALYWAQVTLNAPEGEGRYRWRAVVHGDGLPCAHTGGATPFAINAVPRGQHRLRVEVRDSETAKPIPGAKVVVHPFRALTDTDGLAELLLPPGKCVLMVSGRDHFPLRLEGEMKDDMVIEAVLDRDIPFSEAEIWT